MDLTRHVETLRHQLLVAAEPGGEEARQLAGLLVGSLDASARLMLLDALSDASEEITRELAPGSVEVRLRGRDPEFVVTSAPSEGPSDDAGPGDVTLMSPVANPPVSTPEVDADDGGTSRITLRLPEQLKLRVEEAAGRDGVSVNSWVVRTLADAVGPAGRPPTPPRRYPSGGQRVTGWAR